MAGVEVQNKSEFKGVATQETESSITYMFSTEYSDRQLKVPKIFLDRFRRDDNWQASMFMKYAKTVKNKTTDWIHGSGASKLGEIPENEPFAITVYENVPAGHVKIREDEQYVYLAILMDGGFNPKECLLAVPERLWNKYSTDTQWRKDMFTKYGCSDFDEFPRPDAPDDIFGFIPESEEDT